MLHSDQPIDTAADAFQHLAALRFELAIAGPAGLTADAEYVDDLTDDIAASEQAFVGLAVTEIATLRAELSGRLRG
jgi:hypothetical protein